MSAIVGVYRTDGRPLDPSRLGRMSEAAAHRGRDGAGQWVSGPVGLAHRWLVTTPESLHETQPEADERGECRLVWDGRLDNRVDLIAALGLKGRSPMELSDAWLVLRAYREWGTDCLARIIGDFAFALWDHRTRSLVCARDRMGLKPFHYTWDGTTFGFSSELRPLLAMHETMPDPDDEMVLAFLLREFREGDQQRTLIRGIHRLPPGHFLVVSDGRLTLERYWAIEPGRDIRYRREEDYAEHFLSLFREAVACRLRSGSPIAASLSGGLDSSAIVCTAERLFAERGQASPPLEAFTLFSDHPDSDERHHVREVIRATGLKAHEIYGADRDPLDGLDELLWRVESPIVSATWQSALALMEAVRGSGCRVLLSGEGGDQLLDELGYLGDLLRVMRPLRFVGETRAFARWYGGGFGAFASATLPMLVPPGLKYWGKRIARRAPPAWINRRLARDLGLAERIREARHSVPFPSLAQADTYLSVTSPYYVLKLELEERIAASAGSEPRYPLLDSRLIEFVLAIPWERRTRNGERKRLLRTAMQGIVPEAVRLRRGKGDWTDAMDRSLSDLCRRPRPAPLEDRSGVLGRYVDLSGVQGLVARYLRGERDLRWEVWFLITLDRWLERFWQGRLR